MSSLMLNIVPFKPGMELKVKGVPKPYIDRFSINVCHSTENIALHFDVRFNFSGHQRVTHMGSCKDGCWQNLVTFGNFPFQYGEEFEVTIAFANDKFYIKLQDGHTLEFPNYLADKEYDKIFIKGDITISSICVN